MTYLLKNVGAVMLLLLLRTYVRTTDWAKNFCATYGLPYVNTINHHHCLINVLPTIRLQCLHSLHHRYVYVYNYTTSTCTYGPSCEIMMTINMYFSFWHLDPLLDNAKIRISFVSTQLFDRELTTLTQNVVSNGEAKIIMDGIYEKTDKRRHP